MSEQEDPTDAFVGRMLKTPTEKASHALGAFPHLSQVSPVTEPPPAGEAGEVARLKPGVTVDGVFTGWSGYAKANREIVNRLANSMYVETVHAIEPSWVFPYGQSRIEALRRTRLDRSCPVLRFFGPDPRQIDKSRYRICWTMMETEVAHPDMVSLMNELFDEIWTPTEWNAAAFRRSGVKTPVHAMPLGVDPLIYSPGGKRDLPVSTLLSTVDRGKKEVPKGFLFVYVCLPSTRKGADVLLSAFEDAFADDPDAGLVMCITHAGKNCESLTPASRMKSRVWALEGSYTEHEMADVYRGCDAYVCTSRGEGWNLPACEASACGLPVILPKTGPHPEVFGDRPFYFEAEGVGRCVGAEPVSKWYTGMPFSIFGKKSHEELVHQLRTVRENGDAVKCSAVNLRVHIINHRTWDLAAYMAGHRILEVQR